MGKQGAHEAADAELSRRALEGLAIEEFKAGRLSRPQLRRLLGFETRDELDPQMQDLHSLAV